MPGQIRVVDPLAELATNGSSATPVEVKTSDISEQQLEKLASAGEELNLTPEEIEAEFQKRAAAAQETTPKPTILIHFIEDGLTAMGAVWYRGQELEVVIGSPEYEQSKNRDGHTFLDYADDEQAQIRAYGKVVFRRGPWPGRPWQEEQAAKREEQRRRKPPAPVAIRG